MSINDCCSSSSSSCIPVNIPQKTDPLHAHTLRPLPWGPHEITLKIFLSLNIQELARITRVCLTVKENSEFHSLWKVHCQNRVTPRVDETAKKALTLHMTTELLQGSRSSRDKPSSVVLLSYLLAGGDPLRQLQLPFRKSPIFLNIYSRLLEVETCSPEDQSNFVKCIDLISANVNFNWIEAAHAEGGEAISTQVTTLPPIINSTHFKILKASIRNRDPSILNKILSQASYFDNSELITQCLTLGADPYTTFLETPSNHDTEDVSKRHNYLGTTGSYNRSLMSKALCSDDLTLMVLLIESATQKVAIEIFQNFPIASLSSEKPITPEHSLMRVTAEYLGTQLFSSKDIAYTLDDLSKDLNSEEYVYGGWRPRRNRTFNNRPMIMALGHDPRLMDFRLYGTPSRWTFFSGGVGPTLLENASNMGNQELVKKIEQMTPMM